MMFQKRIREVRMKRDFTQEELGDLVGVSKASICGYERGTRTPTLDTLMVLADVLSVDFSYLLGSESYIVAEDDEEYGMNIAKEELELIKKLRNYPDIYNKLLEDFDRNIKIIECGLENIEEV